MWFVTKQWAVPLCAALMLVAACGPGRGAGGQVSASIERELEHEEDSLEIGFQEDGDPRDDAIIIYGEELDDDPLLRAATWNINRYNERKARSVGRPALQPPTGAARSLQELMTHWLIQNGVDIIAMQEILDLPPLIAGATDPDFPQLDGYTMLPGPKIKGWRNNTVNEHCPIYYRTTQVKSCTTDGGATMALANTDVHWALCTTSRDKQFWYGCAHPAYANVPREVQILTNRMKAWQGSSTQRVEYILGMDANSYHAGRHSQAWAEFRDSLGVAFRPVTSEWNPDFTKISKRGGKVGPSGNPQSHILDWLLFDVTLALRYADGTMTVIPLPRDTRGYGAPNAAKSRDFLKKYHADVSDHMPVKADFHVQ